MSQLEIKLYGPLSSRTQSRVRKYCPGTHWLTELRKRSHAWGVSRGGRLPSITSHLHKDRAFLIPSPNRFFCRRQRWGFALKNKGRVFQHDGYRVISISDEYLWWGGKRWCWHTASVNHMTSWFTGERTMNVVFWIDCPKTWFNTETLFFKKYGEKRKSSGLVLLSSKSHWSAYSIEVEISGWQFYIPLGSRY